MIERVKKPKTCSTGPADRAIVFGLGGLGVESLAVSYLRTSEISTNCSLS